MKALIYKDLVALKRSILLMLVVFAVVGYITVREGTVLMLPMLFVLIPLILLGILFGSDAQSRADLYIVPTPVRRSTIVLSRYAFAWLLAILGILLTVLLKLYTPAEGAFASLPWYFIAAAMGLLSTLIAAIQLPLMYRFGAEHGRLVFVLIYFLVFALFTYLGGNKAFMPAITEKLMKFDLNILSLILAGATLLLNAGSFTLSCLIYRSREF